MEDSEIFESILNDPIEISPGGYSPSGYSPPSDIFLDEKYIDIISKLRFEFCEVYMKNEIFYCEYIKNLERKHQQEMEKMREYLKKSFEICEKLKMEYENVLRNQKLNK
jgi:hypothetical protein